MEILTPLTERSLYRRSLLAVYLAFVLGATLAPLSGPTYELVAGFDKLVHVGLFGGVALLVCWNLGPLTLGTAILVFLSTTAFAAAIEIVQGVLRYRSGDIWDLVAGAIGALLGICFAWVAGRLWPRPQAAED
jgi:VanZ family protein